MDWEKEHAKAVAEAEYYRAELTRAHEVLGRVIHQFSEHWDSVNLTKYYPTDNPHRRRTITNPRGD